MFIKKIEIISLKKTLRNIPLFFILSCIAASCHQNSRVKKDDNSLFKQKHEAILTLIQTSRFDSAEKELRLLSVNKNIPDFWRAEFLNSHGNIKFYLGEFKESIRAYELSLSIREKINDKVKISYSLTNLGMVYNEIGNLDKAQYFLNKALEIQSKENDRDGLITTYVNLGNLNFHKKDYQAAIDYFRKSQALSKKKDNDAQMSGILNNLGATFQELGRFDSANAYFRESLRIVESFGDRKGVALSYNNLGAVAMLSGREEEGIKLFERAISIFDSIGAKAYAIDAYVNLGFGNLFSKDFKESERALNKAFSYAEDLNLEHLLSKIYEGKIQLDTLRGNYQAAIRYYETYLKLLNKQLKDNFEKQLENAQLNYEIELSASENLLLKERVDAQNKRMLFSTAGIIFLVIFIFVLWLYYRQKNISNKLIEDRLLQEIQVLKNDILFSTSLTGVAKKEVPWDRQKIDLLFESKLNESDWKILDLVKNEPLLNNKEIAEKVSLSVEGVRSSLKKMYRLANLETRSPNQKLSLIHWILRSIKE